MAHLLQHFIESPRVCSYLDDQIASLETRVMIEVSPIELENFLLRGWRRFGPFYFRPACQTCTRCLSIRVPTKDFTLSRSQKRVRKHCKKFRKEVGVPRVDQTRLSLYRKWHQFREETRFWPQTSIQAKSYQMDFAFPHPSAREILFFDDTQKSAPKLIGVGICDQTPNAWSAVYFYYDPDYAKYSLGTENVLFQIEHAKRLKTPYVYLGYCIDECPSMSYKANFRPHEILQGRPSFTDTPLWVF